MNNDLGLDVDLELPYVPAYLMAKAGVEYLERWYAVDGKAHGEMMLAWLCADTVVDQLVEVVGLDNVDLAQMDKDADRSVQQDVVEKKGDLARGALFCLRVVRDGMPGMDKVLDNNKRLLMLKNALLFAKQARRCLWQWYRFQGRDITELSHAVRRKIEQRIIANRGGLEVHEATRIITRH